MKKKKHVHNNMKPSKREKKKPLLKKTLLKYRLYTSLHTLSHTHTHTHTHTYIHPYTPKLVMINELDYNLDIKRKIDVSNELHQKQIKVIILFFFWLNFFLFPMKQNDYGHEQQRFYQVGR